ncbi:MAG TPA: tetrahydrofolate dehydrogenase/cyclohydrolase catalytic domain-containing protein [Microlunatus sp.]
MPAALMDGAAVARRSLDDTRERVSAYRETTGRTPRLATVLVGDDPASHTYVRMKVNRCRQVGIDSLRRDLPAESTTDQVVATVDELVADDSVDGILVQHPMPAHIDERAVFDAISRGKDVDGVTANAFLDMANGQEETFAACTPAGIVALLDAYDVPISGKHVVVIGRSPILGKPAAMLLLGRDATVTICHSKTRGLSQFVSEADIVVAAVGRPELIRGDWIKPGAVVIDAGYNPGNVGDVAFDAAAERASLITPVPGGVGPMTIAVLLAQTVSAAEQRTS